MYKKIEINIQYSLLMIPWIIRIIGALISVSILSMIDIYDWEVLPVLLLAIGTVILCEGFIVIFFGKK